MDRLTRRGFLMGCSAAIAGLAGARFNYAAFGNPEDEPNQEILVSVFLRGACDALSVVTPLAGEDRMHYELARPELQLPTTGENKLLQLNSQFGLHHRAAPLYDLYQDGKLALVLATGMHVDTRSHFDAMSYMDLGTPGSKTSGMGWLSRLLLSDDHQPQPTDIESISVSQIQSTSLLGNYDTLSMTSPESINLNNGYWKYQQEQQTTLRQLYQSGTSSFHTAGLQALDTADVLTAKNLGNYTPAVDSYPSNGFGNQLKTIAQMIKAQLGLRVATVDLGGWDTHDGQVNWGNATTGYFSDLLGTLSQGLAALYADLDASGSYTNRLTVVVMTEFGRRLRENAERGTDHGHGGMMMVLGGNVNPGLHGEWPGLANEALYDGADLAVKTDFRRILSEVMIRRLANNKLGTVFPGYADYEPLGVVKGSDLPPDYTSGLHSVHLPLVTR
jgi:uncharacterized protein (DUF1501 family)